MAVLKDTLIQGSARVTDTLYTTNIAGGTVTAPIYWTGGNVALPEKTSAEYFLAIDAFASGGKTYWVSKANTLSSIGAAASGHNHNTTYLRLDGSNIMTGTLAIKPASGEGGELHLCASTANTAEAGIVLDHLSNSLRIFGIASADGTTKTGVGTPLVIDPYAKTITGGYTITGALTGHASSDLALTGGKMTGRIYREGVSSSWHKGRDNSLVAISTANAYSPLASMKTTNGSWEIGTYNNSSFTDDLLFTYITDTLYNGSTATVSAQLRFYETGGALFTGQTTVEYNPNGVNGTAKGMINLTSTAPATIVTSGTYSWGINHLVPNLASGAHTCLITGMGNGTNNSAVLEFNYVGSNHADNSVGLGLYGNNQLLTINKAGTVKIKATTASTSSTTGVLVVGGGIGTGAASYLTGSVHIIGSAGSDALIVRGISGGASDGSRGDPAQYPDNAALYLNLNKGPIYLGAASDVSSDVIYMQYTQDASSTSTGAVRISGGVGIAKKLYVGSTASFAGTITTANNTWNNIGDDAQLGDINKAGHIGIQGKNGNTGIFFTTYNQTTKTTGGAITWDGSKFSITSTTAIDASISGNAATATTATKLGAATVGSSVRGIYLNSGTATALSWYPNYVDLSSGNKSNFPWHRIATTNLGTSSWVDKDAILFIRSKYDGGHYGILKISARANNATTSPKQAVSVSAKWIVRYGFAQNDVRIAKYGLSGESAQCDVYVKCVGYMRAQVYFMEGSNAGWTLVASNEVNDTTTADKKTSVEVYNDVSTTVGAITYDTVVESSDGGNVNQANSLTNFKVTTNTDLGINDPGTNAIGYVSGLIKAPWNYQQTDGSLYTQFYNASWISEIFQDYRTGQLSVRGKNNGTWQSWRRILDETNGATILGLSNYRLNTQPAPGAWFAGTPVVGSDGVTEVGKYVDFHATNTSTSDYDVRITATTTGLTSSGNLTVSNTSAEAKVQATSSAGQIYLFSQASTTGNRGVYTKNAANGEGYILAVDQNNYITHLADINCSLRHRNNTLMIRNSMPNKGDTAGAAYIDFTDGTMTANTPAKRMGLIENSYDAGTGGGRNMLLMRAYKNTAGSTAQTYLGIFYYNDDTKIAMSSGQIRGAVWNDYAEYRASAVKEPGRVLTEDTDGVMKLANERLMPACKVYSDTFGVAIGETTKDNTPIAVSGRVLAYPYRNRNEYHLGDAVCSAPNGTIDIMTREEIMMYPERIIGTVSEIPDYEEWACNYGGHAGMPTEGNEPSYIKVNGRIWIYVR